MRTKKLLLSGTFALLAVFATAGAFAQDVIVKSNGDEIAAKVVEITDTQIKYHKAENLSGPIYNVAKSEVFMIKYENGTKDVFGAEVPAKTSGVGSGSTSASVGAGSTAGAAASSSGAGSGSATSGSGAGVGSGSAGAITEIVVPEIVLPIREFVPMPQVLRGELVRVRSNLFAIGRQEFSSRNANRFVDPYTADQLRKGINMKRTAIGLGVGGAVFVVAGLGTMFGSAASVYYAYDYVDLYSSYRGIQGGLAMSCIGGAAVITAIVLGSVSPGIIRRAIRDYNYENMSRYRSDLRLDLTTTGGGVGMQMTF